MASTIQEPVPRHFKQLFNIITLIGGIMLPFGGGLVKFITKSLFAEREQRQHSKSCH
jgi:hypothetical protein